MAKTNTIRSNSLQTNSVRLNGVEGLRRVSLQAGEIPDIPPTYTLSASVANGVVSATLNGVVVSLPYTANEGDTIDVEVTPNDGYEFNGWKDGNTDNPRSITMNADVALSAQCVEVGQPPVGNYIQFEDKAVEAICVANWSSDGIGLTEEDAAAVATIGSAFSQNTEITSFNEFRYFTGVTSIRADWNNAISSYKGAFAGCSNLRTIKLPASLVTLGQYSFYNCTSLTVDITDMLLNISVIGQYAFYNCPITGKVVMPNVSYIDRAQFYQTNISEVADMGKVTKLLGAQTGPFYNCDLMESITLPDTMTSIEGGSLYYCDKLTRIISMATTPPTIADWSFKGANIEVIYVPDASLEAYRTATNWVSFADRIHPLSEIEGNNGVTLYDRLYGDGVAYIATDYYLKGNEMIESVQQNIFIDSANRALWGAVGTKAKTYCTTGGASNSASMQYVFYYGATSLTTYQNVNNSNYSQFRIKFTAGYLHIADRDYTIGGSRVAIDAPFHIFAKANDSAFWQGWIGQVVLSDENTSEVLAKFTPASYNGEAGMYDEISGKFYGNAATSGTFYVENE